MRVIGSDEQEPNPSPDREPHYRGLGLEALPPLPRQPIHLVLDNIRSAYNVGAMFRTADACAVAHVHLCGMSAHPPHRKLEKTALGAFDYVPWTYHERTRDCLEGLKAEGIYLVAAEVQPDAAPLPAFEWPRPSALIVGNEVTGISERNLARCDAVVQIPMQGYKNSINVATALGILLYDAVAKWSRAPLGGA